MKDIYKEQSQAEVIWGERGIKDGLWMVAYPERKKWPGLNGR